MTTLAIAMPDPLYLDRGASVSARRLRLHQRLRCVHVTGMITRSPLDVVAANGERFGIDRANDYGTLRALSTLHLGIGLAT